MKNTDIHCEVILVINTHMEGGEARNRYSWGKTEAFEGHSRAKELWVKIYVKMESETPEGTLKPGHIFPAYQ